MEESLKLLRRFLFDIVKPSISELIEAYGNKEYFTKTWQRNCCIQTSILTNALLRELLLGKFGYKEIQSWEGHFDDIMMGRKQEYNHAWVYCINQDPTLNLFIDIGRNHKALLCYLNAKNEYPSFHPDYKSMQLLKKEQLDFNELMQEKEHFTDMNCRRILFRLKMYMNKQTPLSVNARAAERLSMTLAEWRPTVKSHKITEMDIMDLFNF